MPKLVSDFLDSVAVDLGDPNFDHWGKPDLIDYVVAGLGEILKYQPDQFTETTDVTLVAGAQQALPANAVALVRPVCSLVAGVPGRAIRATSLYTLDRAKPSWRSATAGVTKQTAYDQRNPTTFYVTPPAVAAAVIRLDLVIQPINIDLSDTLPIDQEFLSALHNYVMFRCYARDTEYAAQGGRAALHWATFLTDVGADDGADK